MDHVAIMKKEWGLIPKILDGRKKIESRWSKNRCLPWGKVKSGDTVYFKNSGEEITVKSKVVKIKEFNNLNLIGIRQILEKYGGEDGIYITDLESSISWAKDKKYCTLIYLSEIEKVRPFTINKKGFGIGAAWISVVNINEIKIK